MTNVAFAVIGSNWGDEGKGLAVDAIAHRLLSQGEDVLVTRSNGGAQAGHGVERPDGSRHVFHHIGSGALAGAGTHLSRFFVASPVLFHAEHRELAGMGANLRVSIDPRACVTTPWDIAINQAVERERGLGRHGSCGMGFGETIERHENGFALNAKDLFGPDLLSWIHVIETVWFEHRISALGLRDEDGLLGRLRGNDAVRKHFMDDCRAFTQHVELFDDADLVKNHRVLFEGAQGLQLDMDYGAMPHVTRSHTGVSNMLEIALEAGIDEIRPVYMTRAYATRHGSGPLPHETFQENAESRALDWADVVDLTNFSNPWQGHIRQAPLDLDVLRAAYRHDIALAEAKRVRITPALGVTCIDQIKDQAHVMKGGENISIPKDLLPNVIGHYLGAQLALVSRGPARETVTWSDPFFNAPRALPELHLA